jgi:hypothetical protein
MTTSAGSGMGIAIPSAKPARAKIGVARSKIELPRFKHSGRRIWRQKWEKLDCHKPHSVRPFHRRENGSGQ